MAPKPATGVLPAMAKQSTPKTMSSRLLTMKFMQRGAAVAAAAAGSGAQSPEASSPATPVSDDGSAKRRKFSHTPSATGSPATPLYDQQAIKAALDKEREIQEAAIQKRAAELGDSHWVLEGAASLPARSSKPLLNVVQVGYTDIDYAGASSAANDDDDDPFDLGSAPAQPQFMRFNMKKSKAIKKEKEDESSGSDSDFGSGSESGEASEDESPRRPPARDEPARGRRNTLGDAERKRARSSMSARREEERKKAQQLAGKRRKKDIKLNQLTSISSAGAQGFQRPAVTLSCHGCGKTGHKVADCPKKRR